MLPFYTSKSTLSLGLRSLSTIGYNAVMAKQKPSERLQPRDPLEFRGGSIGMLYYKGNECLISGAAGTGKSVACLFKIHVCCEKNKGIRCLMVRKTRESLTESGMVTFEQKILPPDHPAIRRGGQRRMRQSYRYRNGSEVIVGGMDKVSKILSTEFDLIYVQEATELKEEDWEVLVTRLRNNKMSYQQILGDCNPDSPSHWLYRRSHLPDQPPGPKQKTVRFESRHQDNPSLYNAKTQSFTEDGKHYMAKLDALTGPRRLRLRDGVWAQSEGVIYPEYDPRIHVISSNQLPGGAPYPPPDWPRYWGVDFGYRDPFSLLMCATDYDRRIYVYKEIYHTGVLVQHHAERAIQLWREEAEYWAKVRRVPADSTMRQLTPRSVICDHDLEDRATLEHHLGLPTTGARKFIRKGIQAVSERLLPAGDGLPRIYFLANMLDRRDMALDDRKQPCSLLDEMNSYVWRPERDMPVDLYNHSCFVAGTMVETDRGPLPIEAISIGDMILTRRGYRPAVAAAMTSPNAELWTVTFSDGRTLTGTANHKIWVDQQNAFVRLDSLPAAIPTGRRSAVYNLTVDDVHEYFANGVLVANCDNIRYIIIHLDSGISGLWETAKFISPHQQTGDSPREQGSSAINPKPRLRYGEDGRSEHRRGGRLFGRK